jgi:hypothetical protein
MVPWEPWTCKISRLSSSIIARWLEYGVHQVALLAGLTITKMLLKYAQPEISSSMNKKSTTQMTKNELIQLLRDKEIVIANLNSRIDELEGMAISSQAVPMDADSSRLLTMMNQRIKALEEKLNDQ